MIEIKKYGKSELAQLYFPGRKAKSALDKLKYIMRKNARIMALHRAIGYRRRSKHYDKEEVKVIVDELCEP